MSASSSDSILWALSAPEVPLPTVESVTARLRAQGFTVSTEADGSLLATGDGAAAPIALSWIPSSGVETLEVEWLDGASLYRSLAERAAWRMTAMTAWRGVAVIAYHQQLRALVAAAGEPVALIDVSAATARPGTWALDAVVAKTPPGPEALFLVHVWSAQRDPIWLHTHGLSRLGHPELEIIESSAASPAGFIRVLNAAAALVIDGVPVVAGVPLALGPALSVMPIPSSEAGAYCSSEELAVRQHCSSATSAFQLLLAAGAARPERLAPRLAALGHAPALFRSAGESVRAALLAQERWAPFVALETEHRRDEGWSFLVQIHVDVPQGRTASEHLWFKVQAAEAERVEATLLSTPQSQGGPRPGARDWYGAANVSDWRIDSPRGSFTPESVLQLSRE